MKSSCKTRSKGVTNNHCMFFYYTVYIVISMISIAGVF
jgi:hypothetical protein